jgi:hypothetical protein
MEPPPPAAGDGGWLILDRFIHPSRRRRGVIEGDATASSLAEDCAGRREILKNNPKFASLT